MATINRKEFLRQGAAIVVGSLFLPSCVSRMLDNATPAYRFFSQDESAFIVAFCEQIIPADSESGGATDANVIEYIDRQLCGAFKSHAQTYRNTIKEIQNYSSDKYSKLFQELSAEEQIEIMKAMERNKLGIESLGNTTPTFRMMLKHTMQGFYGSPIHGGNKDYTSYRMIRLEYPLNIGQNRYKYPLHQ